MTIRDFLERKKRLFLSCHFAFVLILISVAFITMPEGHTKSPPWILLILFFGYFILAMWTIFKGVGCPKCSVDLMPILLYSRPRLPAEWFKLPKGYNHCPGCGVSLDAQVP